MEDIGIWQPDKLLLFIGFVIPGFITLKVYELLVPGTSRETSEQLIDAIAYSCINYAILFAPIYLVETHALRTTHPFLYLLFYVFVLLVAPAAWPCLWKRWRTGEFARRHIRHPTDKPWDHVFERGEPYWIIATLRDGRRIGGRYDLASFASSSPAPEQIYLEECWHLNEHGGFDRCREKTRGVIIMGCDLLTLELFEKEEVDG